MKTIFRFTFPVLVLSVFLISALTLGGCDEPRNDGAGGAGPTGPEGQPGTFHIRITGADLSGVEGFYMAGADKLEEAIKNSIASRGITTPNQTGYADDFSSTYYDFYMQADDGAIYTGKAGYYDIGIHSPNTPHPANILRKVWLNVNTLNDIQYSAFPYSDSQPGSSAPDSQDNSLLLRITGVTLNNVQNFYLWNANIPNPDSKNTIAARYRSDDASVGYENVPATGDNFEFYMYDGDAVYTGAAGNYDIGIYFSSSSSIKIARNIFLNVNTRNVISFAQFTETVTN